MGALPSDFVGPLENENLKFKNLDIRENPSIRDPKAGLEKRVSTTSL